MNLIAAADNHWGIGRKNQLLVRIPEDMQFFRNMTLYKVVIMGRKTFESIPGGALKDRINLVLTHQQDYEASGAEVVHTIEELLSRLTAYPDEDIFVIGGASIYHQLLGLCQAAYITWIEKDYHADVFFPNLDKKSEWTITKESEKKNLLNTDITYFFRKYERQI